MKTTLVIMAAGLGVRYGGVKQMQGFGPSGEILMEYSVYDAIRAGFTDIVFIIRPDILEPLLERCGSRIQARFGQDIHINYVFQDRSTIPDFYTIPPERVKPFGTVHAVLCAEKAVDGPFAVLNADDFYGSSAFKTMYESLVGLAAGDGTMVGYKLKNTVSEHGTVTRGVCGNKDGFLKDIKETYKIALLPDGTIRDHDGEGNAILDPETLVSMNFWGFTPDIFGQMRKTFESFLRRLSPDDVKSEYVLPVMVGDLIRAGELDVSVLSTDEDWFGVTYREDAQHVSQELKKLTDEGRYPSPLWS